MGAADGGDGKPGGGQGRAVGCLRASLWLSAADLDEARLGRLFAAAKWVYGASYLLLSIVTWLLRDYADAWFEANAADNSYCAQARFKTLCSGQRASLRFSAANFTFFGLHAVALARCRLEGDARVGIHVSLWPLKALIWGGLIIAALFMPDDAITVYAHIARRVRAPPVTEGSPRGF